MHVSEGIAWHLRTALFHKEYFYSLELMQMHTSNRYIKLARQYFRPKMTCTLKGDGFIVVNGFIMSYRKRSIDSVNL